MVVRVFSAIMIKLNFDSANCDYCYLPYGLWDLSFTHLQHQGGLCLLKHYLLAFCCRIRERKESVTVLLCGTSGCGKSTLSALLVYL